MRFSSSWAFVATIFLSCQAADPNNAILTPAPWLATLPQTTIVIVQTFVISQKTLSETFSFAVPDPTAAINLDKSGTFCEPTTVTVCSPRLTSSDALETTSWSSAKTVLMADTSSPVPWSKSTPLSEYYTTTSSSVSNLKTTTAIVSSAISDTTQLKPMSSVTSSSTSTLTSESLSSTSAWTASASTTSSKVVFLSQTTSASASAFVTSDTTHTMTDVPIATTSSMTKSSLPSSCPTVLAPGATAPAPPSGTNVYRIPDNAAYSLSEEKLLSAISFPKGFNCHNKLVIMMPGTAVPALDTFSNTFIPAFGNAATIAEVGEVDIMVITVPTVSLGPAWESAEYIAYAMDYANLVLQRPGTILAWSQGNLNVQWAFKYWPSTRKDVPGRNYVAMSADYDGTVLASFLCQPVSIVTSSTAGTLTEQFIANNGLNVLLTALGLSKLPTSSPGVSDPEAFRAILVNFVAGDAATNGFGVGAIGASATSTTPTQPTTATTIPSFGSDGLPVLNTTTPLGKVAVTFGDKREVVESLRARMEKRQNSLVGAGATLIGGISEPILNELAEIVVNPAAPLAQIYANLAKLVTDTSNLSLPPTGCPAGVWDQVYGSGFVNKLALDGGNLAYVPTTSIYSLTDEVVEPQGITGPSAASAFMPGANPGVSAPENIYIQGSCSVIGNTLMAESPPLITHEGVLASGMGISAAILAVQSQSTVSYDQIVARYGQSEACALLSQRLTVADYLANEATIPSALLRVTVNPGTTEQSAQFVAAEPELPSYATF